MLLSKYAVCDSKKPEFINEQEAIVSLSRLGIKKAFKENSFSGSSFVLQVLTS